MGLSRRQFTKEFKLAAVRRLEEGVSIGEAARALEVNPNVLQRWRREFRQGPGNAFPGNGKQRWSEGRIAELERKVGSRRWRSIFEGVLAAHRGAADAAGTEWKSAVYRKVQEEMKADRGLTIARMVELGGVSRASFYRYDEDAAPPPDRAMDLRDAIQRIALEWPSYGRPPITAALRRHAGVVNPKRVYRLLREDNLLCVRKRKFLVTTDSNHKRRVYPNRARQMALTGINQLWGADITYIRLETEFVYLAVVIDAFSRRVIGWALDRTVEDTLTLAALRMALEVRRPPAGWVHHSDRGSQYASGDYTDLLKAHGCEISMSHKASPWENAGCESWMKTLKYEEVYRQEYRDLAEARASLARFIDQVYNQQRLHSALGYRPPEEFEQDLLVSRGVEARA
jgi:putative transposase